MSAHSGLVIVDKPAGWTSHDVVARIRKLAGTRKAGHAGTLDPMATGVLVVGVEKATRLLGHLTLTEKEYVATIRLGQATDTGDAEGAVTASTRAGGLDPGRIRCAAAALTGDIMQVPPAVSALKVNGQRSYKLARQGTAPVLQARPVTVREFVIGEARPGQAAASAAAPGGSGTGASGTGGIGTSGIGTGGGPGGGATSDSRAGEATSDSRAGEATSDSGAGEATSDSGAGEATSDSGAGDVLDVDVRVVCSSGTYIRALARDLGEALGVGGHLTMLRRTRVGPYELSQARTLDELAASIDLIPLPQAAAAAFPARQLTAEQARVLSHGGALTVAGPVPGGGTGPVAAFAPDGTFVALLAEEHGRARPVAVFVP